MEPLINIPPYFNAGVERNFKAEFRYSVEVKHAADSETAEKLQGLAIKTAESLIDDAKSKLEKAL